MAVPPGSRSSRVAELSISLLTCYFSCVYHPLFYGLWNRTLRKEMRNVICGGARGPNTRRTRILSLTSHLKGDLNFVNNVIYLTSFCVLLTCGRRFCLLHFDQYIIALGRIVKTTYRACRLRRLVESEGWLVGGRTFGCEKGPKWIVFHQI